jgi:Spy/CpxP family protein refolding chaperone
VKTWLPWVLLAVSLALNLFLVAGFFWTRSAIAMWRDPEARFEMLADRLDLTDPQRAQFRDAMEALKSKGFGRWEEHREARREIFDMALQPNPDRAAIVARIDEMTRERTQIMTETLDIMLPVLASLTPEQRAEMKKLMEERREMRRRGHWGWGGGWGWGHGGHMGWAN